MDWITFAFGGGVGFVVGAFTPSIGRTIKTWFTKEATAAEIAAKKDLSKSVSKYPSKKF
jgi:hypothetical protein